LLSEIVSSSLDADKMDYLRRDSYHTGVAYGVFDLERVLHSVCRIPSSERDYVGIMEKGIDCLESYRLARYSMHTQVYEHHTRLVADDMFVKATNMSVDQGGVPKEYLDVSNPERFLNGFYELDDSSIEERVMADKKGTCGRMMRDVRERKLLKRAYVLPLTKEAVPNVLNREKIINMDQSTIRESEKKIAEEVGVDPSRVIIHLQSIKIKLYERFEQTIGKSDRPILILTRTGSVTSFDEVSPISASLDPIRRLYVFAPKSKVDAVRPVAEAIFGAKSRF
jgi:HD superfamily phosphohydrolase